MLMGGGVWVASGTVAGDFRLKVSEDADIFFGPGPGPVAGVLPHHEPRHHPPSASLVGSLSRVRLMEPAGMHEWSL